MALNSQAALSQRLIDPAAAWRTQRRMQGLTQPPWLHTEVARRMAQRLGVIKLQPTSVLDVSGPPGASAQLLRQTYPRASVASLGEPAPARRWWAWPRGPAAATAAAHVALSPGAVQLLWSNMQLHATLDPQATLAQWQQAVAVGGFLMFSTLGPGTLASLRRLYDEQGFGPPHAPFVDMHDLGDMLVQAGFADPVMDQETLTLTWPTAQALLLELRSLGGNAHPARHAGLRTPAWAARLSKALARNAGSDGRIALEFELVYGHAFKAAPRVAMAPTTSVPVEDLRSMLRDRAPGRRK